MTNGAADAHRWAKGPLGWTPRGLLDGLPVNQQGDADATAHVWAKHWDADGVIREAPLQAAGCDEPLERPPLEDFRAACAAFPLATGLGFDRLHPRCLILLDDGTAEQLLSFMMDMEHHGAVHGQLDQFRFVFIPKRGGGTGPIGLMATIVRVLARLRKPLLAKWNAALSMPFLFGGPGASGEDANWSQTFTDEYAAARGLQSATALFDVLKCFEYVRHARLA